MPAGYAEARNMVFPKPAGPARSCFHENLNSHQSVPFGSDLFGLRPEWISSFHSDASAQRNCGSIHRGIVRFEISPGRLWASGDFRRVASDQSLRAARTYDSRTDHREHSLVSRPDESGRYRTGGLRHDSMGRRVRERQFGVRRNLSGAGRHENRARAPTLARPFASLTNEPRKENNMSRTILITGVTGNQGGAVAQALQGTGFRVRGLTRKPDSERAAALARHGVDVVKGDLDDEATL